MALHDSSMFVNMDPPIGPNDTKIENVSTEKDEDSELLDVGKHYLARRNDGTWREYTQPAGYN